MHSTGVTEKGKIIYLGYCLREEKIRNGLHRNVMNWGRQLVEFKDISFIQVEIDEAQVKSWGLIPLSSVRKEV